MKLQLLLVVLVAIIVSVFLRNVMGNVSQPGAVWKEPIKLGQTLEEITEYVLYNVDGYHRCLRNIYLPYNGRTTELDILLLHERGIFVFECKDYGGWIFGHKEQTQWTVTYANGGKHRLYNPMKQNMTHCKALSAFLGFPLEQIASYIVFSDRGELKQVPEDTYMRKVTQLRNLSYLLKWDLGMHPIVFSPEEIDTIYQMLYPQTQVTRDQKEQHVERVKRFKEGDICPLCGARLMLRSGSGGRFYECIRYPKCRYRR